MSKEKTSTKSSIWWWGSETGISGGVGWKVKKPTTKHFFMGRGMDMFWNNQTHDELCTRGVFVFSIYQSNIA